MREHQSRPPAASPIDPHGCRVGLTSPDDGHHWGGVKPAGARIFPSSANCDKINLTVLCQALTFRTAGIEL